MIGHAVFLILGATSVLSALVMITRRHPLSAALCLLISLVAVAGMFALLHAPLLFALQLLVYAGAVIALIVFVIMLLNVRTEDLPAEGSIARNVGLAGFIVTPVFLVTAKAISLAPLGDFPPVEDAFGTADTLGRFLFSEHALPFELTSLLLLAALAGVVLFAKRRA